VNSDCVIPKTLAIELTLQEGEVGVSTEHNELLIEHIQSGSRETDYVIPAIDKLMKEANLKPKDLSLIALSIGPSGFTTMRIATTIAKHVSFITSAPIVAVPSAVSAAEAVSEFETLLAIEAVKGDSFWLSTLTRTNGVWQCEAELSTIDSVQNASFTQQGILCDAQFGEIASAFHLPVLPYTPNAGALMRASKSLYDAGETIDARAVTPLYPREPEAVRKWNARRNAR